MKSKSRPILLLVTISVITFVVFWVVGRGNNREIYQTIDVLLEVEKVWDRAKSEEARIDAVEGDVAPLGMQPTVGNDHSWAALLNELGTIGVAGWGGVSQRNLGLRPLRDWESSDLERGLDVYERSGVFVKDVRDAISQGLDPQRLQHSTFSMIWNGREQQFAQLLCLEAVVASELGDNDRAFEAILAGFRFADIYAESYGDTIKGYSRRRQIYSLMLYGLQDAFSPGELSAEQSHRLVAAISGERLHDSNIDARRKNSLASLANYQAELDYQGTGLGKTYKAAQRGAVRETLREGLYWVDSKTVGKIRYRDWALGTIESVRFAQKHPSFRFYEVEKLTNVSELERADIYSNYFGAGQMEARVELARLGVLIELYHKETGDLPVGLVDVSNRYGFTLSVDPFSGRGYGYRVDPSGFLLWSAAVDGVDAPDAHGRPTNDKHGFFNRNIVWRGKNYVDGRHEGAASDARYSELLESVREN